MVQLGANRYGKAEVRVVHVARGAGLDGGDVIKDWNVSSALSGDLSATHLTGDNANVLTTDTQKNTAYAFAKTLGGAAVEAYALALAKHYVDSQEPITRARIGVQEYGWTPIPVGEHAFARTGQYTRTTRVVHDAEAGTSVVSGLEGLTVLKTTGSEFRGFPDDRYTTLAETADRILATEVSARWRFRDTDVDWAVAHARALDALLTAFAATHSRSLQQTVYAIGERILAAVPQACEVRLALPNKHHFLVDLEPFGLSNDNEVYYAADRPYGLIEGTVLADDAGDPGIAWD
ncbi:MAG: urate oxidase [Pseudonocardiales bacterium]|nr:MAG: urate oxidase [Pseudonocardiales bacterium]